MCRRRARWSARYDLCAGPAGCPETASGGVHGEDPAVCLSCACWVRWEPGAYGPRAAALDDVPTTGGLHTARKPWLRLRDVARLVCALHVDLQGSGQPPDCAGMSPLWHGPVWQAPPLRARCLYRHSPEGKKGILFSIPLARAGGDDRKVHVEHLCKSLRTIGGFNLYSSIDEIHRSH